MSESRSSEQILAESSR